MKRVEDPSWVYEEVMQETGLSRHFVIEAIRDLRNVVVGSRHGTTKVALNSAVERSVAHSSISAVDGGHERRGLLERARSCHASLKTLAVDEPPRGRQVGGARPDSR